MPILQDSVSGAPLLSALIPAFLQYARAELGFADQSVVKYRDCLRQVLRLLSDKPLPCYDRRDVLALKSAMLAKGHSVSRQVSILAAFRRLLAFAREFYNLPVLDAAAITVPKRPRRDVVFLTPAEVGGFLSAIAVYNERGQVVLSALRFRALVETLLGSAMRIGELLSLDRQQVDLTGREAKIIGKGNKERVAFFTKRAAHWLAAYLAARSDAHPALFVCLSGQRRLSRTDIWRPFARYRRLSGLTKPVTPHLLRHTAATQMLFNGCPISHIKEILGHARLETTCRYYLGLDRRAAKAAHDRFLYFGDPNAKSHGHASGPAAPTTTDGAEEGVHRSSTGRRLILQLSTSFPALRNSLALLP